MSGRQHSAVKHCANYFYVPLEDDYLLAYETLAAQLDPIKEEQGKPKSASSDCKAMIAATLEAWLNSKRPTAKNENDLYVYLTIDQWVQQLRYRYSRTMIIQCHNEMAEEGSCIDPETGETLVGTIKKRPYIQNMFGYLLHLPVIQSLLDALPEKSPFEMRARPALGRPKKSSQKTDGISSEESSQKLNGINSDGINEKQSKNGPNYRKSSQKTDGSFYITQNHNYTETNITQNHGVDANAQHATAFILRHDFNGRSFYYHDLCNQQQDRGCNEGMTFTIMRLENVPQDAQCDICYQPIHASPSHHNDDDLYAKMPPKDRHEVTIDVTQRGRAKPTAHLDDSEIPSGSYSPDTTRNPLLENGENYDQSHLNARDYRVSSSAQAPHRDTSGQGASEVAATSSHLPPQGTTQAQQSALENNNNNHSHSQETRNGLMDEPTAGSVGAGRSTGAQTGRRGAQAQTDEPATSAATPRRTPHTAPARAGNAQDASVQGVTDDARSQQTGQAQTATGRGAADVVGQAQAEGVQLPDAPIAHQGSVQTDAAPSPSVGNKAVGEESKPARTPKKPKIELTEDQKHRARALKMMIEDRCGALPTKGPNINENTCIALLVQKYADADIYDVNHYLFHCHWKHSKDENKYKIRGNIILEEMEPTLHLFAEKPQLRTAEKPQSSQKPSSAPSGPRYPEAPKPPAGWSATAPIAATGVPSSKFIVSSATRANVTEFLGV